MSDDQSLLQRVYAWLAARLPIESALRLFSAPFLYGALDDRLTFSEALKKALAKPVPPHSMRITWCMGGTTLLLFGNQVVTGILLALYYKPSAETAYSSVMFIQSHVPMGWLIRQMHAWGAHIMIVTLFIHMGRVFFNKAYCAPRELTWVSGAVLLTLVLAFAFTGYLLPWDQLSFWASTVGTQLADVVPFFGDDVLVLMRGGPDITELTLSRFYAVHTIVLPVVAVLFMAGHFAMIRRLGISDPL